jgi:hypothetical protein
MRKAISYLFIYAGIQICIGALITAVWPLLTGTADKTIGMLLTATVAASVVAITIFLLARWAQVSPAWLRTRQWLVLIWSVVAALGALIPSAWLQEQMPELPNLMENEFSMLLANRWGYLAIGLLAPLAEELVFRGAILRALLDSHYRPVTAIAVSALLFAAIHMNPAQLPHAFLIGLLLGWMYWRTGSILPGMAFHWANNSVAYVIYNLYPNPDLKLIDLFKGSELHVWLAVAFSLLILLPALFQLNVWMRESEEVRR